MQVKKIAKVLEQRGNRKKTELTAVALNMFLKKSQLTFLKKDGKLGHLGLVSRFLNDLQYFKKQPVWDLQLPTKTNTLHFLAEWFKQRSATPFTRVRFSQECPKQQFGWGENQLFLLGEKWEDTNTR